MIRRVGVVALAVISASGIAGTGAWAAPTYSYALGIACKGASFCTAVGYVYPAHRPFIAQFNGTTWTTVASPAVSNGLLAGVSCASANDCFAVGTRGPSNKQTTLIEHWDGSAWHLVSSPKASGTSQLAGVSCVSASFCVAVGTAGNGIEKTLVEHWDGTAWRIVPSPNRTNRDNPRVSGNALNGVSCASASSCFAVGRTAQRDDNDTYILRWNGSTWSDSAHQNTDNWIEQLYDASCPTAKRCVAVGAINNSYPARTLTDRWDGQTWHLTRSRQSIDRGDLAFSGVSCASPTSCLAVGPRSFSGYAEYFNGSTWKPLKTPLLPTGVAFSDVVCLHSRDCFVTGGTGVTHWNGTGWKVVATF